MQDTITQQRYRSALEISRKPAYIKRNILPTADNGPGYIYYRVLRPLLKLFYKTYKVKNADTPWTSPASIAIFEKLLTKEMRGFEYGSGNSTKFFARKLGSLVSVEHNKEWFNIVQQQLKQLNITNVDYRFIPEQESEEQATSLESFNGTRISSANYNPSPTYRDYYQFISEFPDASFDFILVDGRARVECSLNAIPKLKPGGMLVLDNSERERYREVHRLLQDWPKVITTTGLTDTTFWFKP